MTPVQPETLMALTAGIQSEIASYVFYREASKKNETEQHKETLEKLALEEKEHFHVLEGQYNSLVRSEKWISISDILKRDGLPEITEEMTAEHRELVKEVAGAQTLAQVLDIAYRLEEEAFKLFSETAEKCNSAEGKKIFNQLAMYEEGHMELINLLIEESE